MTEQDIEAKVISHTAQQCHRDMGMSVDQAGQDILSGAIKRSFCLVTRCDVLSGAYRDDFFVLYRKRTIANDIEIIVHG